MSRSIKVFVFKVVVLITGLIFFHGVYAQLGDHVNISFSGIIYDSHSLNTPLGQVNIAKTNLLGTSSNSSGEFFIDVKSNDTIIFTHVGFHPITITIPADLKHGELVAKLFLVNDTISLEEVYVASLRDFNLFKKQFLGMDVVPNQALNNAKNNINLATYLAKTPSESTIEDKIEISFQKEAEKSIYHGQIPPDNMINLVRVAAELISMLPSKKAKDNFYKDFINACNQNNMVYIKP
jgi:hypothetical protein